MKKKSSTKKIAKDTQMTKQIVQLNQDLRNMRRGVVTPPTQWQLAELVAKLATGRDQEHKDIPELSRKALEIWEAAGVTLKDPIKREISSLVGKLEKRLEGVVIPEGEMTRDKAMLRLLPKRRTADRIKRLRTFLEEAIRANTLWDTFDFFLPREENQSTEELVGIAMETLRQKGFTRRDFLFFAENFLDWHDTYSPRYISETNRNNRLGKKKVLTPEMGENRELVDNKT